MSEAPSEIDTTHADVAVVHATAIELAPFFDRCDRVRKYVTENLVVRGGRLGQARVVFAQCGTGAAKAARGTQAIIDGHTPSWVISAGFSGALSPELKIGDIVVADALVDGTANSLAIEMKMPANPSKGLHVGRVVMADHLVRTIAEKQKLASATGALAVDMESFAVARVCRETKTRFLAVRVICDDLETDLPSEVLSIVGDSGSLRLGAALGALWKRPASFKDMWRLRETAGKAAESLAGFLEGVVVQLSNDQQ
jgi:adenosylhomocysteine nucleosidase